MFNFASDKIITNMTTSISDNFETQIINELMLAQQSIKIAVAWFNSKNILEILCWKLRGGINVEIILHYDEINSGSESSLDFSEYKRLGGVLIWAKAEKSTMHVKFCIIDDRVLLHGSCNWTYRAFKKNDEVLNVTTEEPEMISSYHSTFLSLKKKYNSPVSIPPKTAYTKQNRNREARKNESAAEVHNRHSTDEKRQMFLQALQPFESKYDRDYLQTFSEYWLAENMGRYRFEIGESGNIIDVLNITPEYMSIKLENWQSEYELITKEKQSSLIFSEYKKMAESQNIEIRCRELDYKYFCSTNIVNRTFDRWLGKLLFDRGLFAKEYYNYDKFLQKGKYTLICNTIKNIEVEEEDSFSDFCLLYEANQAFKRNKEYNRAILESLNNKYTYKSFCNKYGIRYASNLKNDKPIKQMVESMEYPIQIKYSYGTISITFNRTSHHNFISKLNEIYRLKLLFCYWFIPVTVYVPYKVLYKMDRFQFDFRNDSFEDGTMKYINLPTEYKEEQYYIDRIEKIIRKMS